MPTDLFTRQRHRLVDHELPNLGISSVAVLQAMRDVPREEFVPDDVRDCAYHNAPLSIGFDQTISQPLVVAMMIEALVLQPDQKVLEIGTGSGYEAAILANMGTDVYTIERLPELAQCAAERLVRLGYGRVHVRAGDGTLGWPEAAPFDAIIVSAGSPKVPPPLVQQLRIGGRLVIPVGTDNTRQRLLRITRLDTDDFRREDLGGVRFVPLIGEEGW